MVVIIILSLASFASLYALPACTKTEPAFLIHPLLETTPHSARRDIGCKVRETNNLPDIDWDLTPATVCDSSPDVQSTLATGQRMDHFQHHQKRRKGISGKAVLLFQLATH